MDKPKSKKIIKKPIDKKHSKQSIRTVRTSLKPRTELKPKDLVKPKKTKTNVIKFTKKGLPKTNIKINNSANTMMFILILFILLIASYMLWGVIKMANKNKVETIAIEYGIGESPKPYKGVIIRDEIVYKSDKDGSVDFYYNDLEKVRSGSIICSIKNQDANDIEENIAKIETDIMEIQGRRGEIFTFDKEAKKNNKQIQALVDTNVSKMNSENFSELYTMKDSVERIMNLRNQLIVSEGKGSSKDKYEEKLRAENNLKKNASNIIINESGLLSYLVDGQEEALNFGNIDEITPEKINMEIDYNELVRKKNVKAEDPIFKIVRSNDWYIGLYVPIEAAGNIKENSTKKIFIEVDGNYRELDTKVVQIKKDEKQSFLLLKNTRLITDFLDMRTINIKLNNAETRGLKIPKNSIENKTLIKIPNKFVFDIQGPTLIKQNDESGQNIPLDVYSEDELYTYIFKDSNKINIGDIVIDKEDASKTYSVSEIENVRGVFVINNGYADFVKIQIDENMSDITGEYVIINSENNSKLSANSRIVADPKNVKDGSRLSP